MQKGSEGGLPGSKEVNEMGAGVDLLRRGVSEIISEKELLQKLQTKKSLRIKLGVDPTSPDLHLGHTVVLNKLKQFQELGHRVIFIIGDFTSLIGDPSGQNTMRTRLSPEEIKKNAQTYQEQVFKILDSTKTEVRTNSEWLEKLYARDLLELGFLSTYQRVTERDDFTNRLKQQKPIAFSECFYPFLQGYDSIAVKADVEIGGTDQKFNLLFGRELQRCRGQEPQVVMTLPLLVGTDGTKKMSKSYGNYVALNDPPNEMFGKLMSISDDLMWQYYELLTNEKLKEIKKMHPKEAKEKLAYLITQQYHGEKEAKGAQDEFEKVFSKKSIPEEMDEYRCPKNKILLSHLLFESGLAPSKKESKRVIENAGVKINGKGVEKDSEIEIKESFVLQVGKRKFKRILTC